MRITILLLAIVCSCIAAPQKLDIPKANWERIFFEEIDSVTKAARWTPLRRADILDGSLEIRVWIGFGLQPLQGFRLRREKERWTAHHVTAAFGDKWPLEIGEVVPKSDWDGLWKKLESLGILALPDSSALPEESMVLDGVSYVVETSDGQNYRTYMYGNPQAQKWPEAKQIIEIVRTLYAELPPKKK